MASDKLCTGQGESYISDDVSKTEAKLKATEVQVGNVQAQVLLVYKRIQKAFLHCKETVYLHIAYVSSHKLYPLSHPSVYTLSKSTILCFISAEKVN